MTMATALPTAAEIGIRLEKPRVQVWNAVLGESRQRFLKERLLTCPCETRTFYVSCNFEKAGVWAGVGGFFDPIFSAIASERPDLIEKHTFELVHILPRLRRVLTVRNPTLTDLASNDEKVRNYAADRAFRIVHGLIDLVASWKSHVDPLSPWMIACDDFDRAGVVDSQFFRELIRRRGKTLHISLILAVSPGNGVSTAIAFSPYAQTEVLDVSLPETAPVCLDIQTAAQTAEQRELEIGNDTVLKQIHLPSLIQLWTWAERPDKVIRWRYFGLSFYCNLGFYADAMRYGNGLLEEAAKHMPQDDHLRWWIIIKTLNANTGMLDADAGLDLAERAQRLAEEETAHLIGTVPVAWKIQLLYLTAMLYARYKQPRDLLKGEEYLNMGYQVIQTADIPEGERHFQSVFNRNGLAMIRSFQGRSQEALDLCMDGIQKLDAYLTADQHRLHRSILNYNIAQVYVAIGRLEEALRYFHVAMEMDPNYSEYYNERGNVYLRLGRQEEARSDYLRAIELSPPYHEVFTNLGQCCRKLGRFAEAVEAYSRALDLEPNDSLALVGRANAYELSDNPGAAIADYTAALEHDSKQWEVLANRGALHYEAKDHLASLSDFDRAIELCSQEPNLYFNRSMVLAELGRHGESARDLQMALAFCPVGAMREEIEACLHARMEQNSSRVTCEVAST